ncbi:MAG: ChaN family lipoprotein [Myxococcaceae bacterium]|nr:ChaN family lipoprotein [Myxococcaceae bacterium]
MRSSLFLGLLAAALLAGCATSRSQTGPAPARAASTEWLSPLLREHPLAGRIWDVSQSRWLEEASLREELTRARFVLLGEKHDNADHHRLQASLVRAITEHGRRPALAFEMLGVEQQAAVDAALASEPGDPDAIAQAVDWAHSSWPDWALYRPIFAAGLERGLPIVAANLPKAQARALVMKGASALPAELVTQLGLDTPLPEEIARTMREEMFHAHCGAMPAEHMQPMVEAQRARDAQMAERLHASDQGEGVILITGSGHARTDRGVPVHLARRAPGLGARSVAFVEVVDGKAAPQDYAASFGPGPLPFDYLWFTPGALREDPCAKHRERMRHDSQPPSSK